MNNNENIAGERLKELRGILNLSQTGLGIEVGVASNYISACERGRRKIGIKLINRFVAMAERYGVKIDQSYLRPDLEEQGV